MRILFADTAHPSLWDRLVQVGFECVYDESLTREMLPVVLASVEGIVIRSRFKLDKALIDAAPRLKFIARVGAGMENIDREYAESRGIACLNAPEGNRNAVAEHALGMLLALLNNLLRANRQVRQGIWIREGNRGYELSGKTVALIGYGNTGSAFAQRLRGFDIRLLAYDPYKTGFSDGFVEESNMEIIFREADVLSLHVPLTGETHYLVNETYLNRFQKSIYVINTARGKCLNTTDLVKCIESGKVLGAALDVHEYESLSFETLDEIPEALQYVFASDKVILSPHIAGWTHESNQKMADVLVEKIVRMVNCK